MYRALLFVCFVLTSFSARAQITVQGVVLDRDRHTPIAFANIGIRNSSVGTLSNGDGSFLITIPENLIRDTLQVSALGFASKVISISFLTTKKFHTIYLSEKATMLEAITVTSKRQKNREFQLGNRSFNGGVIQCDTLYSGRSMALLIESDEALTKKGFVFPVYLEKARIKILKNNLRSCRFRIRLNAVDSITSLPGEDILQKSIVVESFAKTGWIEFDLSSLNLVVNKSFYVTFEQITDVNDRTRIADGYREFIQKYPEKLITDTVYVGGKQEIRQTLRGGIDLPGTFVGISRSPAAAKKYYSYVRQNSFGEWIRVSGIVTATVTVSNQKISQRESAALLCEQDDTACRIEKICKDFITESGLNGIQLCISKGNVVQLSRGFGYADVENRKLVSDSTRFRINSVTKALTSAALIKLVSENRLDLDAPVQMYVPSFPLKSYPITTRLLAGHLAGFRDYNENDLSDYIRNEHYANSLEALAVFKDDTLMFEPGTKFSYSTFGWNLIGAIIESVSGLNYLDYMQKNIFDPLKMNATCGDIANTSIPNRSKFYDALGNENELGDWSYKYSGAGLLSTAEDLVAFGNELLHGNYFDLMQRRILFESQHTSDDALTGYGLGWYIGKDRNGHRIWHHGGDSFSGSSHLMIYPDDDLVIAFLANGQEGVWFDLDAIAELFYR
jgi:serine beta-lactamase-like protein LACTB